MQEDRGNSWLWKPKYTHLSKENHPGSLTVHPIFPSSAHGVATHTSSARTLSSTRLGKPSLVRSKDIRSRSSLFLPLKRHLPLDLGDGQARVEALGACPGAVEDGVATIQAHRVVEGVLALRRALVARVDEPTVRLQQDGGAEVLLRVPPVRRAGRRAARAQNALVEAVELLPVRLALPILFSLREESCQTIRSLARKTSLYLHPVKGCPSEDTA